MERIFNLVLVTSLYASIVGISIIILKTLLKHKVSPKWHYLLWIILVIKLVVPFGPESTISLFNKVPSVVREVSYTESSNQVINNAQNKTVSNKHTNVTSTALTLDNEGSRKAIDFYLSYAWLTGAILMGLWLIYTNLSLYLKLKKYEDIVDEKVETIFKSAKSEMSVNRNINIVFQPIVNSPALFGIFKPRILFPKEVSNLNDKEISYILLHELAHYKRKDILANYILLIFQVIHWFNPIIWFCFKKIREDMELATDEKVLNILEGNEHKEYGKALLKVLESLSSTRLYPKLIGMVDDKKGMEKRIRMIKMANFFRSKRRLAFVIGLLCIIGMGLILLTSGKTKEQALTENKTATVINEAFTDSPSFEVLANPAKYTPAMSSTPGIKLQVVFEGEAETVQYYATKGKLITWETNTWGIKSHGSRVSLPYGTYAYWSPLVENDVVEEVKEATVKVQVYNKSKKLIGEKEVNIERSQDGFYCVVPSENIIIGAYPQALIVPPITIDEAVSRAVLERSSSYMLGELPTEGHVILRTEEKGKTIKVYAVASYHAFAFENGIFTKVSGSGAIPIVITLEKTENNEYILKEYKEPMDGAYNIESTKKMFPKDLWDKALKAHNYYPELTKQQEEQAARYLESIDRKAEIISHYSDRKLIDINVEASNKLFSEYTKYDSELNKFPYWLGTREEIQDGIRYIYETSQSKTADGYDFITFTKKKEDGTIVKEHKYKIVGTEPQLIE